jgi:hypothetical protein
MTFTPQPTLTLFALRMPQLDAKTLSACDAIGDAIGQWTL